MTVRRRRKTIGGAKIYKPWKDWSVDDFIIGKFTQQSIDNYDKPCYHIEIEEFNLSSPKCYKGSEIKVGTLIGLNSCGSLDYKMEEVEIGQTVEITYMGTETLPDNHKFKGKDSHQVDVAVLEDEEEGLDKEIEENFGEL
jgi:hypothetical protein